MHVSQIHCIPEILMDVCLKNFSFVGIDCMTSQKLELKMDFTFQRMLVLYIYVFHNTVHSCIMNYAIHRNEIVICFIIKISYFRPF